MMTKTNSTMIAPAYTSSWITARKCALRRTKMAERANIVTTRFIAAVTGLRWITIERLDITATDAKI